MTDLSTKPQVTAVQLRFMLDTSRFWWGPAFSVAVVLMLVELNVVEQGYQAVLGSDLVSGGLHPTRNSAVRRSCGGVTCGDSRGLVRGR